MRELATLRRHRLAFALVLASAVFANSSSAGAQAGDQWRQARVATPGLDSKSPGMTNYRLDRGDRLRVRFAGK